MKNVVRGIQQKVARNVTLKASMVTFIQRCMSFTDQYEYLKSYVSKTKAEFTYSVPSWGQNVLRAFPNFSSEYMPTTRELGHWMDLLFTHLQVGNNGVCMSSRDIQKTMYMCMY